MSASNDTILAIDLGRYKCVACVNARSTRAHTFRTIDTTPTRSRRRSNPSRRGCCTATRNG
jgi:hypothetical protein